jgi:hypothetical protein
MPQQQPDVTVRTDLNGLEPLVLMGIRRKHVPYEDLSGGGLAQKFKPLIQGSLIYFEELCVSHV